MRMMYLDLLSGMIETLHAPLVENGPGRIFRLGIKMAVYVGSKYR